MAKTTSSAKPQTLGTGRRKTSVARVRLIANGNGKITINIPANATGFVILSGNFTEHPIYVDQFTNGVAVIPR